MLGPVHPRYIPVPFQDSAESGRLIPRDGSTAQVRVATDRDSAALADFFRRLSPESRRHRFLSASPPAPDLVSTLCQGSDGHSTLTLVATRRLEGAPQIIATGSYLATGEKVAEVALAVDDAFRGKGLGTLLLERLALLAAGRGFTRFWAVADPDNRPVLEVFRASGFYVKERAGRDQVEVDLSVIPTGVTVERLETRDRVATIASLRPFFRPNAVAVVGASRNPAAIGHRVLQGLLRDRFSGPVYAVNPRATEVIGVQTYPSVRELPGPTDLAILAVPRAAITGVVDDCAAHGVRALVVLTADFAEAGPAGAAAQKALLEQVRGYGMRMVGPNCLGLINADPAVRLNATFSPVFPPAGRVAMSSQSGAVGLAALSVAGRYGMGISTFVSVGNKADVSGNDLLQYWEEDAATDVILLYLESLGNPRRFARIARRVGRRKPVVVLHSGLTKAGARAAGSHTAALAASVIAADALFRQCGVIRAESLEELLDLAMVLGGQPLPRGRRVGIVTNAGGPGILCADACEAGGLEVPDPSPGLRARIAELVPGAASLGNPTDLLASAGAEAFRLAVEAVLASGEVDALIVIYAPVGLAETGAVCEGISRGVAGDRAAGGSALPVLTCVLGQESHRTHLEGTGERIPCYSFPETPARALGKVAAYAAWQAKPAGEFPDLPEMTLEVARAVCRKALADRGPGWLSADEVRGILAAAGLPLVPGTVARTPDEAAERAAEIGFPVAVKLDSRTVVHKSDVGGVRLGLTDADSVRRAFREIRDRLEHEGRADAMDGVLVQPMVRGGVEVMAGATHDLLFGPLIAFGLGGVHVEVLADVCFRVAPLSDADAAELVRGIRGFRLLEGYRGHPAADLSAIEETLLRVSRLAEEVPEIGELDLNPVFAFPPGEGCRIADARVQVRVPANMLQGVAGKSPIAEA